MGTDVGDTRLLAHVDSLKALDPEVFFIPFLFSWALVTTWKVGCPNSEFLYYRDCRKMTPKSFGFFFFFFLLKIICLLLHATGQISSFKTKVQQGQETPPSQPPLPFTYTGNPSGHISKRLHRYKVTKSTSEYIVSHGRITKNFSPKKGFNFSKIKSSKRVVWEQTNKQKNSESCFCFVFKKKWVPHWLRETSEMLTNK